MILSNAIFSFFKKLHSNNNRDWFLKHKPTFKSHESQVKIFGEELKNRLNKFDDIDRFKVFRIYRDVRFSKDKTPFKTHFGLTWHRIKPQFRGGYYLHISPGNNFLACGFWDPNPSDLKRIRQEFMYDAKEFKDIMKTPSFHSTWGELKGSELKTAPRGMDKNHPEIELIRKKQYIFSITYSNKEVCEIDFIDRVEEAIKKVQPFVNYMSEVLTTDENGESIL
jgi:uncharacterized protein (TIGR02453 family)|tara:strand:+ start:6503 stop:7171 length:669 start_codon:yes stop_codon:yes gene_type:complete